MIIWTVEYRQSADSLPILIEVYANEESAQEHMRIERLSSELDESWMIREWNPKTQLALPDHMLKPQVKTCTCSWCAGNGEAWFHNVT